jgi:predicted enzyme related to lactoylglutathione lyase
MLDTKAKTTEQDCAQPDLGAHGSFCWNELITRDSGLARKFYADTIGWSFEAMPMPGGGTYWIAKTGGKSVAGLFEITAECAGATEGWMPYIAVDDVDMRVEKALAAGAQLMRPIFDIPGVGRIAILREPGGAGIAWMTPTT